MKILVIDSCTKHNFNILLPFLNNLQEKYGHSFEFFISDKKTFKPIQENNWKCKKILFTLFSSSSIFTSLFSIFFLPFALLFSIFKFLFYKSFKKSNVLILFSYPEKILYTVPARIFKKKIIWVNMPGENNHKSLILQKLTSYNSRFAQIVAFTDSDKIELVKNKICKKNIHILYFGIDTKNHTHQENIFSEIAESNKSNNIKSKFFTVGTVTELNETKKLEVLFSSIKKCISIIPNIQFIVVGDGKMRKNLVWVAKKMEIDNLVWFVGEHNNLRKWLTSFDVMISNCKNLNLHDMKTITEAMATGVPVIAPYNVGLEYLIDDNRNGILINTNSSEEIAANIMRIQQNKQLKEQLKKNARETIDNLFKLDNMIVKFEKILNEKN